MNSIAVIGGGASGIMAAITAARLGCDVTILEKNDRIGKKLLATGNGRCNLTNINADISDYHGGASYFADNAKAVFWVNETIDFFSEIGLLTKVEDGGKIYPYSDRASSVLDVLRAELERLCVKTVCGFDVMKIKKTDGGFKIISYDAREEYADKVIFSAGGKASPSMGGGSGYDILKKLGHTCTSLKPSIVQLKTNNKNLRGLKGVKCHAKLTLSGISQTGELLFTDDGLSGPPAFYVSSYYNPGAENNCEIDFFDGFDEKKLFTLLKTNSAIFPTCDKLFTGILHKAVSTAILKQCDIQGGKSCASLTNKTISDICRTLKHFPCIVTGTESWNNAQVTSGGIKADEVICETLESKKCKGLYITGEILDIDGNCGGYNLQWAWSSGYIAAQNASCS